MTDTICRCTANRAAAAPDAAAEAPDFLPLKGIDHVEFWVGNAKQAAAYYRALWGFTPVAYAGLETGVRDRASYVMVQNDIRFVFTAPLTETGELAEHVRRHGDGVHDIAFAVDDVALGLARDDRAGSEERARADRGDRREGRAASLRDPHLRRGAPLVHRPQRLPRHLRAGLSPHHEARGRGHRTAAARGGPLRRQRGAGRHEPVRRLLPRRARASAS